jgi:hypothetical protein
VKEGYDGSKKISVKQLTKADLLPLSYTPTRSGPQRGQRAEVVSPLDENVKIAVPGWNF